MKAGGPAGHLGVTGVTAGPDLIAQRRQVSLEAFVFALQRLDAGQVVAVVVRVQRLVLLLDPLLGFVGVPERK